MVDQMPERRRYRFILDFSVWINDEILNPYSDEYELDKDEKQQLQVQRSLLKALLADEQGILEELLRKRLLEEAISDLATVEMKGQLFIQDVKEEVLLRPVIEKLSKKNRQYLLKAIESDTFEDVAGDVIYSIGVELEDVSLTEREQTEQDVS